jgi:rare lipoprotein A
MRVTSLNSRIKVDIDTSCLCTIGKSALSIAAMSLLLQGCISQRAREPVGQGPTLPPADAALIPDAVPRAEPRAALGNPPFYDVFGKRYFVLPTADGFVERGVASWYGPGFHKERTATGDPYDMYAMTAAHKTLPLPCYARVTNLANGRSVVVHINDRGPFKDGRIVDLSYTAAAKLDMLRAGTALVELQVISGNNPLPGKPAQTSALYVQAGAFGDATNAERVVAKLREAGYSEVAVVNDATSSRSLHRVRIGPIATAAEFDRVVAHLKTLGLNDARLATD